VPGHGWTRSVRTLGNEERAGGDPTKEMPKADQAAAGTAREVKSSPYTERE